MTNTEIARVFSDVADLLELKDQDQFKIRAYRKAARSIEELPSEMERLAREIRLQEIPGVGEAIARKITELVTTGRLQFYERLKAEFPGGIRDLLGITGVGPRTAMLLHNELGVNSADELEAAIVDGRVARLPRMGKKTAENILRQIQATKKRVC
jgi:DNA polymerase (family 10)